MTVRRLYQRTRPFRYGGFWMLTVCGILLAGPAFDGGGRGRAQLLVAVLFCAAWPWLADRLRASGLAGGPAGGPAADSTSFDTLLFLGECLLTGAVIAWASMPPLAACAASLCLLGGALALAGWRLLLPATGALLAGSGAGTWLSPELTARSSVAADAAALALMVGFTLALGHQSYRQAVRLDGHRKALAEKSAALERINARMQRYLPPSLRDRVAQAPDEPCRWERRWLTVAFVDLVGFTELSERLEAELLARILDEYLGALIPAAEQSDGEVSKLLGDGVLVVFGMRGGGERRAPVGQALGFCRELPGLLDELAERWRARGEPVALEMRAGIASGFCTLGDRGGAGRLDFTLIGPPVNLASRLQAHAPANGVLLDEATAALAEASCVLTPRRELEVKGLGATAVYAVACPGAS